MGTTNKCRKKYDSLHVASVKAVAEKNGVSNQTVYNAISKTTSSGLADKLLMEYNSVYKRFQLIRSNFLTEKNNSQ